MQLIRQVGRFFNFDVGRCLLCGDITAGTDIGRLKKHAKKGKPWAQFVLGSRFFKGKCMTQSYFEAVRWYRKAASQGHPEANLWLSKACLLGKGCTRDLNEAYQLAALAMTLDSSMEGPAADILDDLCEEFLHSGAGDKANELATLLALLAEGGCGNAQLFLGKACYDCEDYENAKYWFAEAALQDNQSEDEYRRPCLYAFASCGMLGHMVTNKLRDAILVSSDLQLG